MLHISGSMVIITLKDISMEFTLSSHLMGILIQKVSVLVVKKVRKQDG